MTVSRLFKALLAVSSGSALTIRNKLDRTPPSATTKNGTYNESWSGTRNATEYSPQCIGYGMDTWSQGNYVFEDCLTLNVVRTADDCDKLPVLVWFHGGALVMGCYSDRRYNQSFIVQQATEAGMPIVAVSFNYRLSSWAFLYGKEIQEEGSTMNGFRDTRLALHWIQENITAFGGDPARVTIMVRSTCPYQHSSYHEDWEPVIANISAQVGCANATSVLACLRTGPSKELSDVFNSTSPAGLGIVVDAPVTQLDKGAFVAVPFLIGSSSDEGVRAAPANTTKQFLDNIATSYRVDNSTAQDLAILYPDFAAIGPPATLEGRPAASKGLQFKRVSALVTDVGQGAPRRLAVQMWAKHGVPA
ncbi:hypothetical protein MBLNU13_g06516t2 [Cladosporium sp. NU13]